MQIKQYYTRGCAIMSFEHDSGAVTSINYILYDINLYIYTNSLSESIVQYYYEEEEGEGVSL